MPLDLQPYKYSVDPYTGKAKLDMVIPYVLYGAYGRPDVYFQGGQYYFANGDTVPAEQLKAYGLNPEPKSEKEVNEQRMEPPPEVKKIISEGESATLRAAAIRISGRPTR